MNFKQKNWTSPKSYTKSTWVPIVYEQSSFSRVLVMNNGDDPTLCSIRISNDVSETETMVWMGTLQKGSTILPLDGLVLNPDDVLEFKQAETDIQFFFSGVSFDVEFDPPPSDIG